MLAYSCGSLGTISSTNIFGIIARDENKVYLPWDIIIHLILRGEQNQKIFQTTFSPSSGSQWLPERLGQEGDLLHLCIVGVIYPTCKRIWSILAYLPTILILFDLLGIR